jgi:hypothetical protein
LRGVCLIGHHNVVGRIAGIAVALGLLLVVASPALASLAGSGQVTDVVNVAVDTSSLASSLLQTTGGQPIASSSDYVFDNGNSNVDTFTKFAWGTTPYYGGSSSQTSVSIHGTTYQISDLLYFEQETRTGAGTVATSSIFAPLLLKNSATIADVTFTTAGNACTAWTGSPAVGFIAASAGTMTFKYHTVASPTSAPATTQTFNWCLDTTNSQVYWGTAAAYASDTLVVLYSTNSALATLKTYQYDFIPTGVANGAYYCLTSITGSGTAATPDMGMCEYLPYSSSGSAQGHLYPLFDPPAAFPSGNQLGSSAAFTYTVTGTQWDPYQSSTTNSV